MDIYQPAEDSNFLALHVKKYAKGRVLDVGTGSGIQAKTALKIAEKVIAVDINEDAIKYCKEKYPEIEFRVSDLFSNVIEQFDLIIFNPPYLPMDEEDEKVFDPALFGGKNGWEIIERFLIDAKSYLKDNGRILLLISSLTNQTKVEEILTKENYNFKQIDELKMDFERLYIYEIGK